VLTHGGPAAAAQASAIAARTAGVFTVLAPATSSFSAGNDSLLSVIATNDGTTAAGKATVPRLRAALASVPGGVQVGGNTAQNVDFTNAVYGKFPLMLTLIALVTFALLARSFRSVALALKAVGLNVISLGASYGFLVLFWQQGHGSKLLYGVPATGGIRDWVPIIMFAFLFGLSMDYEVFVLARDPRSSRKRKTDEEPRAAAPRLIRPRLSRASGHSLRAARAAVGAPDSAPGAGSGRLCARGCAPRRPSTRRSRTSR
jgi:putative drug exporter of the RND superfamily